MIARAPIRVRRAEPDDAAALTEVFLGSRAAAMPYLPRLYTDEQTLAWMTRVVLRECRVWVAEAEQAGAVLGFAALSGESLEQLYVRADLRGRGIGSRLLAEVRAASAGALRLRVFQRNGAARQFYERHGFVAVDFDDGGRNEEGEPDATYRWTDG